MPLAQEQTYELTTGIIAPKPWTGPRPSDSDLNGNGFQTEEDRGWLQCCEPLLAIADRSDSSRVKNSVNSRWRAGSSVTFTLKKSDGTTSSYSPVSQAVTNDPTVFYTTIEWHDVATLDGFGCYYLESTATIAGIVQPTYVLGIWELKPYEVDGIYGGNNYARILSYFNDYNNYFDVNFTGENVPDSLYVEGKFGYYNPNTLVDNVEFLDGTMEKVRREDFYDYELRIKPMQNFAIWWLHGHLLGENTCFITDQNADNFEYYQDKPVIVKEGFVPEHNDGTRKLGGVCKFEDKKRRSSSHFANNNITSNSDVPANVCVGVTVDDGGAEVYVPNGGTYTCVGGGVSGSPSVGKSILKTGQITSYRTADDGDVEQGRATDFDTLPNAPVHFDGSPTVNTTTNRLTDELGGTTYANDIVIDWSTYDNNTETVLGYYFGDTTVRTWNDFVDWGAALSVGTFTTNWYAANVNEILYLFRWTSGLSRSLAYAPFNSGSLALNTGSFRYFWTSTTYPTSTVHAPRVDTAIWATAPITKTTTSNCIATRLFTVSGTTLT